MSEDERLDHMQTHGPSDQAVDQAIAQIKRELESPQMADALVDMDMMVMGIARSDEEQEQWDVLIDRQPDGCPECLESLRDNGKLYKVTSPEGELVVHKRCAQNFCDRTGYIHPAVRPAPEHWS